MFEPLPRIHIDKFAQGYIDCALWCGLDCIHDSENSDPNYDPNHDYSLADISPDAIAKMLSDCLKFVTINSDLIDVLDEQYHRYDRIGHDFWLTRNRHGSGYWDGDYPEPIAGLLTESSHSFGECDLYIGDDGLIYLSPM